MALTSRQQNSLKTRDKIYAAAIKAFIKKGFDNIRVEDITKEAGVSKGSFYTHFKTKESIIYEYFRRIDKYYSEIYEKDIKHLTVAFEKLFRLTEAVVHFSSNICGIEFLKIIYSNQILRFSEQKLLKNQARTYFIIIDEIISYGVQINEFRNDLEKVNLIAIYSRYIHGMLYDWCLYDGSFDLLEETKKTFPNLMLILKK